MNYLIVIPEHPPFLTKWYDYENYFVKGMIIFNLNNNTYSYDGKTFIQILEDHL